MPRRDRAGFFPLAIELVSDLPLLNVVALYLVRIAHPGSRFLRSSRTCIHANHGFRVRERLDVIHERLEIPLDVSPVGTCDIAVAGRHRIELVAVAGKQIHLATIELHLADLHALARQFLRLESNCHVARTDLLELVLGRLGIHLYHGFRLQFVLESLVNTRVFRVILGPVSKLEGLRAQLAPVNLQGIEIHLLGELDHDPGRIVRVQDFAPPHRLHLAVGKVAPADKPVVVLGRTAVNRLAQEAASPLGRIGSPEAGTVVLADTVPVVIIRKAAVREAEHRVAAVHKRIRHVVVAARRIPDGKVGRHHVRLVDGNSRMQVIDNHHVLRRKRSSNTGEYRNRTREQRGNLHKKPLAVNI